MNIRPLLVVVALAGCASDASDPPPGRDPIGPTDPAPGRRVRRLTADQFERSLEIATGQAWSKFGTYAEALGRPDFGELTEEGTDLSVTFDKLVHDASREACGKAVDRDRTTGDTVILREVVASDRDHAKYVANLKYLTMRFLGVEVEADDDARLAPWLGLLEAEPVPTTDVAMATRWKAVCVGLVTHPDFLTY
ncbi:MAG: hypothetical protein R3B06_24930 [Kofleriaceae bacterium]